MKFKTGLFAAAGLAFAAVVANAETIQSVAVVSHVDGKVLVNVGEGFRPVAARSALKAGDRVFVGDKATVSLTFKTCNVVLSEPTVYTVSESAPCESGVVQPVADVPAGGYPPGAGGVPPVAGSAVPPVAGPVIPPVVTTVVFLAPLVACAVKCKDLLDNSEDPQSGM